MRKREGRQPSPAGAGNGPFVCSAPRPAPLLSRAPPKHMCAGGTPHGVALGPPTLLAQLRACSLTTFAFPDGSNIPDRSLKWVPQACKLTAFSRCLRSFEMLLMAAFFSCARSFLRSAATWQAGGRQAGGRTGVGEKSTDFRTWRQQGQTPAQPERDGNQAWQWGSEAGTPPKSVHQSHNSAGDTLQRPAAPAGNTPQSRRHGRNPPAC